MSTASLKRSHAESVPPLRYKDLSRENPDDENTSADDETGMLPSKTALLNQTRVIEPISLVDNSNEKREQVTTKTKANGTLRLAALIHTAPKADEVFKKFGVGQDKLSLSQCDAARQPYLSFFDLPHKSAAMATGNARIKRTDTIPPRGVHRYALPNDAAMHNEDLQDDIFSAWHIMAAAFLLAEHDIDLRSSKQYAGFIFATDFHKIQGKPFFDIQWPHTLPSLANRNFTYTPPLARQPGQLSHEHTLGQPVEAKWCARGPLFSARLTTIGFSVRSPAITHKALTNGLADAIAPHGFLIDLWQIVFAAPVTPSLGTPTASEFNYRVSGDYLALIGLQRQGLAAVNPYAVRTQLPGFLELNGKAYVLQYLNRRNWCPVCRPPPSKYHEKLDCPSLVCKHCNESGKHFSQNCPQYNTGPNMAKDNDELIVREQSDIIALFQPSLLPVTLEATTSEASDSTLAT